ncbi:TIGR03619 family F420-dependent LLM class oxidoreductase [Actinoplanes sp. TBRC 11911]|uniref:TIGR03619 family F420-dependent LLM class oxidoreductase n=1 Tax=Actinoplanes sp. TBRC 11911 TaxID=2729386 RepID=UPI00145E13DF|nr:TIGR03619 family F420-dependent LLM class oxidoreductase [Actinoplanes sp. TBRC 11911]NMO55736.1 TIGR03619 family F420-dependent LLM class oxidoreductase [Actinoplanes sp. TBRC 11911]
MELGLALPTAGPQTSPETIVKVAQEAEMIGYDALWTFERLLRPLEKVVLWTGGEPQMVPEFYRSTYEPLETLSYVAAVTERVKLGTAALVAPLHVPVMLARRFATLDQLSGGRVIAGVAQGWEPHEFETANVPSRRKGARTEEFIAAMRAVWGPDPVQHEGEFYQIAPSQVNPKPVQAHIPVLLGATSPAAVKRAARIADGLLPLTSSAKELRDIVSGFHDAARAEGRNPADLMVVLQAPWPTPLTRDPIGDGRPFLGGSPRQVAEDLLTAREIGVTQVYLAGGQGLGLELGMQAADVDEWLGLLGEVIVAAGRLGVLEP